MLNIKVQKVQSIQHDSIAFPVLFVVLITVTFFHLCTVNKLMQQNKLEDWKPLNCVFIVISC